MSVNEVSGGEVVSISVDIKVLNWMSVNEVTNSELCMS